MSKLWKEWNFFFDTIGKCFMNKCSNFNALTQTTQQIGYSLITNDNFDYGHLLGEYIGNRIYESMSIIYFGRFLNLIFQFLCPDVTYEDDT